MDGHGAPSTRHPARAALPDASLAQRGRNGTPADHEEYLDDVEDMTEVDQSKSRVNLVGSTAPKPQLRSPVSAAWPAPLACSAEEIKEAPEAALRFMSWLQTGLAEGALPFNQAGAMVHFVQEGMLWVSPQIFQHFARIFGEDGRGGASSASGDKKHLGLGIQKQLLKAGWHLRREKGINILPYQVLRGGKPAAPISGVVIARPERFVSPVPPANPHVVRVVQSVGAAQENALSA